MKKIILSSLILLFVSFLMTSCGEDVKKPAVALDAEGYYTRGTVKDEFSWSLDSNGVLKIKIEEGNKTKQMDASNADYLLAIEPIRDKVIHMEIERFTGRINYNADKAASAVGHGDANLCANMPNLQSVHFVGDKQSFWVEEAGADVCGLFYGSSSLKTVWFGDEKTENVADLSGIAYGTPSNRENYFATSLFSGCSSLEKVIIPRQIQQISTNSFKGCSSLSLITLGIGVSEIAENAFADCTSLESLIFQSMGFTIGENAIPDNVGLIITLKNINDQKNILKVCMLENADFYIPIDEYWIKHMDEKIASIPDGKSFIIFTDTHFQSGMNRSTRKLTSLIKYVRDKTGIKTVINLGDPYSGEDTIELSDQLFSTSVEEYFFDEFGTDGLFAVGNHDANYTTWLSFERAEDERVQIEGENGCGAFNYILPDTNIYERSVGHIADTVVFDTKLIEKLESLTYTSVGKDAGKFLTHKGLLDQVYYSAEEMKEQAYAWARMHYHYDDTENKIRYIVLDTGDCGLTTKYTLGNALWTAILPTQYDWLAETLNSTPEGYDVAVVGHMLSHYDEGTSSNRDIYRILSAFRSGSSYSFSANSGNSNMKILIGDSQKNYDFSERNFDGTVFTMSGHWHQDETYVWYTDSNGSYQTNQQYFYDMSLPEDAIFYVCLNNDCQENPADELDPTMSRGNSTENCFTIVTITDNGDIHLTRIGAGEDKILSYNN